MLALPVRHALLAAALSSLVGIACSSAPPGPSLPGPGPGPGPEPDRFAAGAIGGPSAGYVDSVFVSSAADRVYFLHSPLSVNDFLAGAGTVDPANLLPGHTVGAGLDWNTDLYEVAWLGTTWSAPRNLGSAIDGSAVNSLADECCVWLDDAETELIFYRETFGLPALGPRGNYRATRASRDAPWGRPELLPGVLGSVGQTASVYRHDLQRTASGDLYLWEHDPARTGKGRLLRAAWDGAGWGAPAEVPGSDSGDDETQPWVSRDERTLLFDRRAADGSTTLWRMSRSSRGEPWGAPAEVPLTGFADANGNTIWGEPTLSRSEDFMLFVRFDTAQTPWRARLMFARGSPGTGFGPPVPLN